LRGVNQLIAKLFSASLFLALTVLTVSLSTAQDDLSGVKCVMNAEKSATLESFVEYKKGKVYFCCDHCADAFREDIKLEEKSKFATKANHQLVLTGQFEQKGCPMSGSETDEAHTATVGTIKVKFCCEGCAKKVNETEELADKANLVFSDSAFKKAFHKKPAKINLADVKCMMMPKKGVVENQSAEYLEGKVFFCCGGCVKKFAADPEKFSTAANQQLVATGQFVQTGCPISGGDVDDEQSSVVGGVAVKFCCDKCKAKVDGASSEEAKAELVFGKKRFAKAFEKQ